MTTITIDDAMDDQLRGLREPAQLRNKHGIIIGEFLPAAERGAQAVDGAPPSDLSLREEAETTASLRRTAERIMPLNAELMKLPDSPPPAEWWDEESLT